MSIVISHPTGNQNVRAVLNSFSETELLTRFITTVAINARAQWLNFLPNRFRQECLRRTYSLPAALVTTHPYLELARIGLSAFGFIKWVQGEYKWASIDSVYKNLDMVTAKKLSSFSSKYNVSAVYAYEDGAFDTFSKAKKLGLKCIYDLPIAYWETSRKLLLDEAERLPQWVNTLGGGILDSRMKLERKTAELELADIIITPGKFVSDSLPIWAKNKKIITSPFGSPMMIDKSSRGLKNRKKKQNQRLRVLFVGSMGQRKGLGDLFNAIKLLNCSNIELVVLGAMLDRSDFYRKEFPDFTYEIGRPHKQVLELMQTCDVFCLPSIVEGRALVMQEAMSQGLPLIITPNTGGDDLILEEQTGFLVPIRSPQAIAEKLSWFLDNRSKLKEMSVLAQEHAGTYTWEKYGMNIVSEIKESLCY
ncbi:glycosyltransferase family 4 protein [Flavisolibacter tropicus]|uniref:Group 1 glycosyl transferase n=1 Tax=Flavisolibacter tropicus TaxID=1492898 RepID=A0A172TQC3_9BACT|nr:glycosyltransferase family 4 protein [Flavisolibacter tropicus]ANE49261.1 group 1 glycosyl transferase [Flavisolibacter tropicus]